MSDNDFFETLVAVVAFFGVLISMIVLINWLL